MNSTMSIEEWEDWSSKIYADIAIPIPADKVLRIRELMDRIGKEYECAKCTQSNVSKQY